MTACLVLGLAVAGATSALTLSGLVEDDDFFSRGGVTYSDFEVTIKGKGLSPDLGKYEVNPTDDGFLLTGDFSKRVNGKAKGGKIKLSYVVTGFELRAASLAIDGGTGSDGKLRVREKVFDGGTKVAKLKAKLGNGDPIDEVPLIGDLTSLNIVEKIKIKGDYFLAGSDSSITNSFAAHAPEPTTAVMLAAGLAGLTAAGRRRPS